MGVVVSGTHFKSTTEIAGDLHRGAAQFQPLCLLFHKLCCAICTSICAAWFLHKPLYSTDLMDIVQ